MTTRISPPTDQATRIHMGVHAMIAPAEDSTGAYISLRELAYLLGIKLRTIEDMCFRGHNHSHVAISVGPSMSDRRGETDPGRPSGGPHPHVGSKSGSISDVVMDRDVTTSVDLAESQCQPRDMTPNIHLVTGPLTESDMALRSSLLTCLRQDRQFGQVRSDLR